MEHNPYISFPDDMEITYSDLKKDKDGEYITLYFERPNEEREDFQSADCRIPGGKLEHIKGFSEADIPKLYELIEKVGDIAFDTAKEDSLSQSLGGNNL